MNALLIRSTLLAGGAMLGAPLALLAHGGHAGDHGWLAGAAQPLLSLDHFLAGSFVALVLAIGLVSVVRLMRTAALRQQR